MELLKTLCAIHAPSGEESAMTEYILYHIVKNQKRWKVSPEILFSDDLHDNLILVFGKPRTAVFAHLDSVGFTAGYENDLHPIGSPAAGTGAQLSGTDHHGKINCVLTENADENDTAHSYAYSRQIELGTSLIYAPNFKEEAGYVSSPYLDNRLGVRAALKLAETLENGIIVFTTYEEHGGGGAEIASKFIYENYNIKQALILDVTWVTKGIKYGNGTVISLRDTGIPRKSYTNRIRKLALEGGVNHQLEVEGSGGSDGTAIQTTPYPIDWCFVGIPAYGVHSPFERAKISDYEDTLLFYKFLMENL